MDRSQRGFTLIELLVSIVILAVTMMILTEGLRMIGGRVQRQENGADMTSRIIAVDDFLRAELADARPVPALGGLVAFDGGSQQIAFVSSAPESIAAGGLLHLALSLVRGPHDGAALILAWHPYPSAGLADAGGSQKVLLDRIAEAHFAYFAPDENTDAPQWLDTWTGMRSLPLLVRLRLTLTNGDVLPDLIVALRLSPGSGDLQNTRRRF